MNGAEAETKTKTNTSQKEIRNDERNHISFGQLRYNTSMRSNENRDLLTLYRWPISYRKLNIFCSVFFRPDETQRVVNVEASETSRIKSGRKRRSAKSLAVRAARRSGRRTRASRASAAMIEQMCT